MRARLHLDSSIENFAWRPCNFPTTIINNAGFPLPVGSNLPALDIPAKRLMLKA